MQPGRRPSRLGHRRNRAAGRAPQGDGEKLLLGHRLHIFKQPTRLRILAARFARALRFSSHPSEERAQGRPGAGWHPQSPRAKSIARAMHRGDTGQPRRPAFPAQWFDGLCRALPGDEFLLASVASRIGDAVCPVGLAASPQDLTVATTARTTRFRRTQASPASPQSVLRPKASQDLSAVRTTRLARCSRGSAQSTAPPCHLHPRRRRSRPPQPDPRLVTTYDRPFRRIRMAEECDKSEIL